MAKDKYFKYYNPNPEGHEDACDCVVRALCAATGLSWYEVYDKCCEIGKEYGVMPNASGKKYSGIRAEAFGLESRVIPAPKKGERSMTVQKFCEKHRKGKYVLTTAHHDLAVIDGKYWDLCEDHGSKVYKYYELVEV